MQRPQEHCQRHEQQRWQIYRTQLFHFVFKRVHDEATAEDIVHDVLTKAYAQRDLLREPGKLQQWLYQITRNAIVDYYRTRKPMAELPYEIIDAEEHGNDNVEKELARCLMPMVEALPTPYRQAVMLAEFEDLPQREVAAKLGLSVSGAKSRVQRARKMLEAMLLECCRLEFDRRGSAMHYEPKKRCDGCGK
jgi:RNA polymerase sigma-70 factor, ECF subfamily